MNKITQIIDHSYSDFKHLFEHPESPEHLHVQGSEQAFDLLKQIPQRGLGIVGTRSPTTRGIYFLQQMLESLKEQNLVIISGFARGIDYMAHATALDHMLPTVAILGSGLEYEYPKEHYHSLKKRILDNNGLLVSEYNQQAAPQAWQFIQRNRLISLYSRAVVIAEAPEKSGALNTAHWSIDFDRPLFAPPCFPDDPIAVGNQKLLEEGYAQPIWSAETLKVIWPELKTNPASQNLLPLIWKQIRHSTLKKDVPLLCAQVYLTIMQNGEAYVPFLLDWAFAVEKWSARRFFSALNKAITSGLLKQSENRVILCKPEIASLFSHDGSPPNQSDE